jgi:hypothetical protein
LVFTDFRDNTNLCARSRAKAFDDDKKLMDFNNVIYYRNGTAVYLCLQAWSDKWGRRD